MQPSPGSVSFPSPQPDLPHTRARPVHWIATATALAAVLGVSALVQPSGAIATPPPARQGTPAPSASAPVGAPDPKKAVYPVDCGPEKPEVIDRGSGDLDGDGRQETVAVVRCATGFGTPPSGIYVLTHPATANGAPRVAETFLDPKEGLSVTDFAVRGRTVSATLLGYSSKNVPRCCPDKQRKVKWRWRDGKFALIALPVAGSV
ncbi:hypothetical protein [Streptomyces sp. KR80]|uniref:hypothetical protein n=1 Tax=Streptomyces sp. KR80 TaxID=3457426 RepID=UPI003FCF9FE7